MALDQIEATLDDQHALQQKNDRSDRRTQYALSHQQLTAKLVQGWDGTTALFITKDKFGTDHLLRGFYLAS